MKYIDADLLRKETEKHIKEVKDAARRLTPNMGFFDAKLSGIYDVIAILDSLTAEPEEKKGCGVEFPHFGAQYPDGKCINGYLWDMDSYEDGSYTIGGDDPCPICNTEEWLKDVLDDEIFKTREDALKYVEKLKSKYAYRNKPDEPVSEGLEEAAEDYADVHGFRVPYDGTYNFYDDTDVKASKEGFITGAKWQKQQMLKGAVEGAVCIIRHNPPTVSVQIPVEDWEGINISVGDKVRLLDVKED